MENSKRYLAAPSTSARIASTESPDSRPNPPSPATVKHALLQWCVNYLSFLALLAAYEGILSGSQALEAFVPGHGTSDQSDADVYMPDSTDAVADTWRVFHAAKVEWNNFLLQKFVEAKKGRPIVVPYAIIWDLVDILISKGWSTEDLQRYLEKRFSKVDSIDSHLTSEFLLAFTKICNQCRFMQERAEDRQYTRKEAGKFAWTFQQQRGKLHRLPKTLPAFIDGIIRASNLSEGTCYYFSVPKIASMKEEWERAGMPPESLRACLIQMIIAEEPYLRLNKIQWILGEAIGGTGKTHWNYDSDFRTLRGTFPNGKKLQVMLFNERQQGGAMRICLQYYGTHVMSCISGIEASHLYYSTAKKLLSRTLDFRGDLRQSLATKAIEKYRSRGWSFRKVNKTRSHLRNTVDKHTKTVDLESLYCEAYREVTQQDLQKPSWWDEYFKERRDKFQSYSWLQENAKIDVKGLGCSKRTHKIEGRKFLDWVQNNLGGHSQVIPRNEWEVDREFEMSMDIWFTGIHFARDYIVEHRSSQHVEG